MEFFGQYRFTMDMRHISILGSIKSSKHVLFYFILFSFILRHRRLSYPLMLHFSSSVLA